MVVVRKAFSILDQVGETGDDPFIITDQFDFPCGITSAVFKEVVEIPHECQHTITFCMEGGLCSFVSGAQTCHKFCAIGECH